MSVRCSSCGIGDRTRGACDWCGAPTRVRVPLWTAARRRLRRSRLAASLRRAGPVPTGVAAGVALHLSVAAVGVAAGLPSLWQSGFFWPQQWWWVLLPDAAQPWTFAALRGAVYGALAGWVMARPTAPSRVQLKWLDRWRAPSPAVVTAAAAFVVAACDPLSGLQNQLVAAVLGAAVGRLATLIWRTSQSPGQ